MEKFKKYFIAGLYIIIPVLFAIILVDKAIDLIMLFISPISMLFGENKLFGINLSNVAALAILIVAIMILGVISGRKENFYIISKIEKYIPGYKALMKLYGKDAQEDDMKSMQSCLATVDDAWLFGLVLEQMDDGMLIVYIPSAPIPTSGNVYIFTEQQIKRLDIPPKEIIRCISQLGVGANSLLKGKVTW